LSTELFANPLAKKLTHLVKLVIEENKRSRVNRAVYSEEEENASTDAEGDSG